jgi:hypothetical protein
MQIGLAMQLPLRAGTATRLEPDGNEGQAGPVKKVIERPANALIGAQ